MIGIGDSYADDKYQQYQLYEQRDVLLHALGIKTRQRKRQKTNHEEPEKPMAEKPKAEKPKAEKPERPMVLKKPSVANDSQAASSQSPPSKDNRADYLMSFVKPIPENFF